MGTYFFDFRRIFYFAATLPPVCHHPIMPINRAFQARWWQCGSRIINYKTGFASNWVVIPDFFVPLHHADGRISFLRFTHKDTKKYAHLTSYAEIVLPCS